MTIEDQEDQLLELNNLAAKIYYYVEQNNIRLTRRRLLILQTLLYVDTNTNAAFYLLKNEPPYIDGAEMILRSIYDLSVNVDWVLKARTNVRLWRWLRDDKKMLHRQLTSLVDLKTGHPKLNSKQDPLSVWQGLLAKTGKSLTELSTKANVRSSEKELSLFAKVKTFSIKSQQLYHTMFWLFSTKTHASATGMQELMKLDPFYLKKRTDPASDKDAAHALMLSKVGLRWYAAQLYRDTRYLNLPFIAEAKKLYEANLR